MNILYALLCFAVMGIIFGVMLAVASRAFAVKEDARIEKVRSCLPGANCGCCGQKGCSALAEAIVHGQAECNACTVGGKQSAEKIAAIMGVEVDSAKKMHAVVLCSGYDAATVKKYEYDGEHSCLAVMQLGGGEKACSYACVGYGTCMTVCRADAISVSDGVAYVDERRCIGCGACVKACPKNIIKLVPEGTTHIVKCSSCDRGIDTKKYCESGCIGCRMCEKICESGAISVKNNIATIDYEKCTHCGACAEKCPRSIIANCVSE